MILNIFSTYINISFIKWFVFYFYENFHKKNHRSQLQNKFKIASYINFMKLSLFGIILKSIFTKTNKISY